MNNEEQLRRIELSLQRIAISMEKLSDSLQLAIELLKEHLDREKQKEHQGGD